jgi:hypothetical protein
VPPQPPKGSPRSPDDVATVTGGGGAPQDHLYSIYQRLTTIESSQTYMTAAVDDSKAKIETLSRDFIAAKAKFDLLLPIAKTAATLLKGILAALCLFGLTVFGMWLKNHYGWK